MSTEEDPKPKTYEPPQIMLVGNMNDLLAGNGSKDSDDNNCSGVGTEPDPSCGGP